MRRHRAGASCMQRCSQRCSASIWDICERALQEQYNNTTKNIVRDDPTALHRNTIETGIYIT